MYKDIQEKFNKIIEYSQEIEDINTDDLFSRWEKAKQKFIKYFGDRLIYTWPYKVSFELDDNEKNKKVSDLITQIEQKNTSLARFIEENKKGFYENFVLNDYTILSSGIKIPKGMRLLKAFKFFESDKERLENFQSIASMIIQENKVEGILCFSVHPLDFLSASENNHNWHSCHALDGDFRAGNLSYMTDDSTIMVYLKSDNDVVLPDFPGDIKWNDKKWRMWLHFSDNEDMLFAGRQYPFFSKNALNIITKDIFKNTDIGANNHCWSEWDNRYITNWFDRFNLSDRYLPVSDNLIGINELVKDNTGALHYNDLLYSNYYTPYYSYRLIEDFDTYFSYSYRNKPVTKISSRFRLGGAIKCVKCKNEFIKDSNTFMCPRCELKYGHECNDEICECSVCGCRAYREDCIWLERYNEWVCEDCQSEVAYCSCCDEYDYVDNMIERKGYYYCKDCYEQAKEENRF